MSLRDNILELLDHLDGFEVNLNSYFDESGVNTMLNGVVSGRLSALAGYLRQLQMPDLLNVVIDLDPEPNNIVSVLETVRSYVSPELRRRIDVPDFAEPEIYTISTDDLVELIEKQRSTMISVATDGPRIQSVNREFIQRQGQVGSGLSERGIRDPNPFSDLWEWYGKWSSGDLPTYKSRRDFVRVLYDPLIRELRHGPTVRVVKEATGWERVDRGVDQHPNRGSGRVTQHRTVMKVLCRISSASQPRQSTVRRPIHTHEFWRPTSLSSAPVRRRKPGRDTNVHRVSARSARAMIALETSDP
jgi:hypothetical protein